MTPEAEPPRLLTIRQAAQRLGIPRTAVYQLVMRGQLTSVKIGRLRRVPVAAIDELIERLITEQAPFSGRV